MSRSPMESTAILIVVFYFAAALSVTGHGEAAVVEHTFVVSQIGLKHLCKESLTIVVNGQLPGPTIEVVEGDDLEVHVVNRSPYGITIHWHGVKQRFNCWADGVGMVTQCPIQPGQNFTYRFTVAGQEGTLWWHAHVSCLRATVHGALVIRPRSGTNSYPFLKSDKEIPIIIGDWWEMDPVQLENEMFNGTFINYPDAATINGQLGDLYNCSGIVEDQYMLNVEFGKTYLLRMVNAALFSDYHFKIAGHKLTVVAADANYVKPYITDIVTISPGQTLDILLSADALPTSLYYMVAMSIQSPAPDLKSPLYIARGIVQYNNPGIREKTSNTPLVPEMPDQFDTTTSFYFQGNLTSLPHTRLLPFPEHVDEHMYVTLSIGSICRGGHGKGPSSSSSPSCNRSEFKEIIMVAVMNNVSYIHPVSPLLEAHYNDKMSDIDTLQEFPDKPPRMFNYTDQSLLPLVPFVERQWFEPTTQATVARWLRYNTTVEVVFQGTSLMQGKNNPMHLHGHDFFVLGQGYGNYDADRDPKMYNLVDPPLRNTVLVPRLGWTAIRFVADNPGVWLMHCHYEFHVSTGMAVAFVVENGPTLNKELRPPPEDLPRCDHNNSLVAHE